MFVKWINDFGILTLDDWQDDGILNNIGNIRQKLCGRRLKINYDIWSACKIYVEIFTLLLKLSRPVLSSLVSTGHVGPFKFKLLKIT